MQAILRSAVFKLTVAYVSIIMAICLIFSVLFFHITANEIKAGFNTQYSRWLSAYQPFGLRSPATPQAELQLRIRHIYDRLVLFNVVILVTTSAGCYILARRTLRPIAAAHEQQKRFTADVSHELRTPLTALRMESEVALLDTKTPAKDLRLTLESNLEEVTHMESLINNLLQLSTLEAGQLRTAFERHDMADIVRDAVRATRKLAQSRHVEVTTELSDQTVLCDRPSMTQLVVILLENAIKYSPDKSVVEVSLNRSKGQVHVDIGDHGSGIPAVDLPNIFDRFYRSDSARRSDSTRAGGYGLGLSLAKLIADLHEAEIVISSAPGSGTTASIIVQN